MKLGHKLLGQGKNKVVVMNDWFCDCSSYDAVIPYLNTADFQYAFVDLRGYGASKNLDGEYGLAEASADVLETASALSWEQFHLVGYSMTGLVGQNITAAARKRVLSFIGICPVGPQGMAGVEEDFFQFMAAAAENDDDKAQQISQMVTSEQYSKEWAEFKVRRMRETSIAKARLNYLKMFVYSNVVKEVEGVTNPLLVISGGKDIDSLRQAALMEAFGKLYKNIEFAEIPNCGHSPMLEVPPALATAVNAFLSARIAKELSGAVAE